jgi:2-oxoglutarate ferredoxin oxidoreductase subunit alpha
MQENLGYAAMTETPCVIVNVMRGGPSTGMPTRPAQGDFMQARWGTHGDHPIIVVAPASVQEIYTETIRAFNLAEEFRTPAIVLYDEVVAHLIESVELPARRTIATKNRKWAAGTERDFAPYAETDDLIPAMARPGDGLRAHVTGLTHTAGGFPTQKPELAARAVQRILDKIERHRARIERYETLETEDAEVVIVAVGIVARAARRAVRELRAEGIKAGLFRPITLWPFPEGAMRAAAGSARRVLTPEMNAGQLALEVERLAGARGKVARLNRIDGEPIAPAQIAAKVRELVADE